jgi:hypothetical protein
VAHREPSNAAGKQLTGAGDACNRTPKAVERTVPFAFLIQSLMICWYAVSCDSAAVIADRRSRCPWYRSKATHRPPTCTPPSAPRSPAPE